MAPIVSIDVDKLNLEHMGLYLKNLENWAKYFDGKSAKLIGTYMVEVGGSSEVITISKFDSLKTRDELWAKMMSDPEVKKMWKEITPSIKETTNHICLVHPAYDIDNIDSNAIRMIRAYRVAHGVDPAEEYPKALELIKEHGINSQVLAILFPIFTPRNDVGLVALVAEPADGFDKFIDEYVGVLGKIKVDAALKAKIDNIRQQFQLVTNKGIRKVSKEMIDFFQ